MNISEQLIIEDYLSDCNVFENGISGEPCHSDSYMTIVNPDNLMKALENNIYDWLGFKERVMKDPNTPIPMKIVCCFIQ